MFDDLEALVGHLYIVGGRAVSTMPPGALVELPPRKPQRGREADTFFTLITPAGDAQAQAGFYEQLAKLAGELYFGSGGSVTSGLREAINGINSYLVDHNQIAGNRYSVNVCCAVMRGNEVFVARTGESCCLLRQGPALMTYPEKLNESYSGPLVGHSPVVDIRLSRHEVAPGHVMVLSDVAPFRHIPRENLAIALDGSIQGVMDELKSLLGSQAQVMVLQFASLDDPDPLALTAANARISRASRATASRVTPVPAVKPKARTGQLQMAAPAAAPTTDPDPQPDLTGDSTIVLDPAPDSVPDADDDDDVANSYDDLAMEMAQDESAVPPLHDAAVPVKKAPLVIRLINGTARVLEAVGKGSMRALDRMLPEASPEGPRVPSMLVTALVVFIPVVVVFSIVAVRLSQQDTTQFEQMVRAVEMAAEEARTIPLEDTANARTAWLGVMQRLEEAERTSGRSNDPTLALIRAEAQGILDTFALVTRRTVDLLRTFDGGATMHGPVVRAKTEMYTLDVGSSSLWYDRLNPADNTVFRRSSSAVVVKGQAVGPFSVRSMIDFAWMADGSAKNRIVAVDTQGILVTYSPVFAPATAIRLAGAEQWIDPVAMTVWRDRLYILDPGANQIWRYTPVGETYPNPPEPYFQDPPDLSYAVDLAIDLNPGNVYVLYNDGAVQKFLGGTKQVFEFMGMPEDGLKSASSMYLDADSTAPALYIVDPRDQAIYQLTLRGNFLRRFKASDVQAFRHISSVYVDDDEVYIASGSIIYHFSMADLTGGQ